MLRAYRIDVQYVGKELVRTSYKTQVKTCVRCPKGNLQCVQRFQTLGIAQHDAIVAGLFFKQKSRKSTAFTCFFFDEHHFCSVRSKNHRTWFLNLQKKKSEVWFVWHDGNVGWLHQATCSTARTWKGQRHRDPQVAGPARNFSRTSRAWESGWIAGTCRRQD